MKAERRHELATNELADWIANFPQWFEQNRTSIIVGAVLIVGLIAYTIFFYSRQSEVEEQKQTMATVMLEQLGWHKQNVMHGRLEGLNISDAILNTAGSLNTIAEETDNPRFAVIAMIKRAEALRTELHYRQTPAEQDVKRYQLQQAKEIYQQALEKAKGNVDLSAMAEYGIALCLEDMGDFEAAEKIYEKIATSPDYQGSSFVARANFRKQILSDYKQKFFFARPEKTDLPEQKPYQSDEQKTTEETQNSAAEINQTPQAGSEANLIK